MHDLPVHYRYIAYKGDTLGCNFRSTRVCHFTLKMLLHTSMQYKIYQAEIRAHDFPWVHYRYIAKKGGINWGVISDLQEFVKQVKKECIIVHYTTSYKLKVLPMKNIFGVVLDLSGIVTSFNVVTCIYAHK